MKRAWLIAAVAGAVGLGLAIARVGGKPTPATVPVSPVVGSPPLLSSPSVSATPLRVAYPKGKQFIYAWSHRASNEARLGDSQAVRGTVDLDGQLMLRGHGEVGGASLVGVSFAHLTRHQLSALGQDLLADDEAAHRLFDGREAFAEIAPNGAFRSVRFHREDPALFKNLVLSVLLPVAMSLRDDLQEWTLPERTGVGLATTKYSRTGASSLSRSRIRYESFRGLEWCNACAQWLSTSGTIELGTGWVRSIAAVEELRVARPEGSAVLTDLLRVSLTLVNIDSFQPLEIDVSTLEAAQPGDVLEEPGVEDKLLAARVKGLSLEEMLSTLASVSAPGAQPPPNFVARSSALLMQHPEHCAQLAALFERKDTTSRTKALVMDVLASAATPQAQKAMREALASRAAKEDPSYSMLLQRFAFVPRPEKETADFVAERYNRARSSGNLDIEFASAHTLGAIAGQLSRTQPELGRRYDTQLRNDLAGATSTKEKKELLAALGNAHSDEDVRVSQRYASSDEPELRAEAARALRDAAAPEARRTLISLVADAEPSVQVASLSGLSGHSFSADEATQFSSLVLSDKTPVSLDNDLLSFLGAKAASGTDVRSMVEYISQRTTDVRVRARANLILEQLAVQSTR